MDTERDLTKYVEEAAAALHSSPAAWWARQYLEARGLVDRTIRRYRLGYDPDKPAIVIPYLNALGDVVGCRYRMLEGSVRYMSPKGEPARLFHVSATRKPRVFLTEGEFDAMTLDQMGLAAVGVPGANAFKDSWRFLFAYCEQVTLVFDGDEAGDEAGTRIARLLTPYVPSVRLVRFPPGRDVNDIYVHDRKKLVELLA